jgi:hypothetical protein
MTKLPTHVYLVTVDTEWPVSAIASDHPSIAERVQDEVLRRFASENVMRPEQVHVRKACLTDVIEVDLVPARTVGPFIVEKSP